MAHLEFGIISEIDFEKGLARVKFPEDNYVSAPLKISAVRAGPDQFSFPFDINEHVWCLMDDNCEYGVIGGAIYDETNKPDGMAKGALKLKFADNSSITYNRNSHTLSFDIKGKVNIQCNEADLKCSATAKITAPETTIEGILNVTGAVNVQGVASVGGLAGIGGGPVDAGEATITAAAVKTTDDVSIGTLSLKNHKHTAPSSGGPTSGPIP